MRSRRLVLACECEYRNYDKENRSEDPMRHRVTDQDTHFIALQSKFY